MEIPTNQLIRDILIWPNGQMWIIFVGSSKSYPRASTSLPLLWLPPIILYLLTREIISKIRTKIINNYLPFRNKLNDASLLNHRGEMFAINFHIRGSLTIDYSFN